MGELDKNLISTYGVSVEFCNDTLNYMIAENTAKVPKNTQYVVKKKFKSYEQYILTICKLKVKNND